MKKVIMFTLFTFLFIPVCKANDWKDYLPKNIPIIILDETTKYKWYKIEKVNNRTKSAFEHNCEYFDVIKSQFSEWSKDKPEEKENRIVEEKEEVNNAEYNILILYGFETSELSIKEINIYDYNRVEQQYDVSVCEKCIMNDKNHINDTNYDTIVKVNYDSRIFLKLTKVYNEDLNIEIQFDNSNTLYGWDVKTMLNFAVPIKKYSYIDTSELYKDCTKNYCNYRSNKSNKWNINEELISKYYRYKDNFVECYDYQKKYIDGYFFEYDDEYIKDETSIKTFYKYVLVETEHKEIVEEFSGSINDFMSENNNNLRESIDYRSIKEQKDYSLIPVFIITLGGILILLVLICIKMRQNLKNSR